MAKIELGGLGSGYASTTKLNEQLQKIQDELNNKVLYRDNPSGEANSMSSDLDMNSNQVLNVAISDNPNSLVPKSYVDTKASAAEQAANNFATAADIVVTETLQNYANSGDAATLVSALIQAAAQTDEKLKNYDPQLFLDYGLVIGTVGDLLDYGSVV